jgi:hypothetical protein
MAGRYQGRHIFTDDHGRDNRSVEVFWGTCGWYWRPCKPPSSTVGPFTTSTEAYQSARLSACRGATVAVSRVEQ